MDGTVTAVSVSAGHTFSKQNRDAIRLLAGLGVEGDAHAGETGRTWCSSICWIRLPARRNWWRRIR